jgi:hypothetical protein
MQSHPPLLRAAALALSLLAAAAAPAAAQEEASAREPRVRWAAQSSVAVYGTGGHATCERLPSLSAGVEARTTGTWFAALSGDVYVPLPAACSDVGALVPYGEGRFAYDDAQTLLIFAPRLAVHAGRVVRAGGATLEPAVGAGMLLASDEDRGAATLNPWAGGSVSVRRTGSRLALRAEYGVHRVPVRHEILSGEPAAVVETREFGRWEPLVQLGLRLSF